MINSKIFHSNMVLNRHYCQHTSVVTDNIVAHMNIIVSIHQ